MPIDSVNPIESLATAMPPTSGMVVLSSTGKGLLVARALGSIGQDGVSMVNVNPQTGEPSAPTTPQQIMTPADPAAKLEMGTPAMTNTIQGISTPQMGMNR